MASAVSVTLLYCAKVSVVMQFVSMSSAYITILFLVSAIARPSVVCLSVVRNARAPYSGG